MCGKFHINHNWAVDFERKIFICRSQCYQYRLLLFFTPHVRLKTNVQFYRYYYFSAIETLEDNFRMCNKKVKFNNVYCNFFHQNQTNRFLKHVFKCFIQIILKTNGKKYFKLVLNVFLIQIEKNYWQCFWKSHFQFCFATYFVMFNLHFKNWI